ncbi:hypothetical protein DEI81_10485 [Curtobacterium sp. MCBD17_013]|uniref:hypothetical protein n=1 Tax=Curtobacterium sp. MCBD17_013 TaxID=2175668 RepID=UPI000DA9E736|nr:hypothetical protein [Curtobacterium sp. MCBD17_013]PZF61813.1 hypothetical protein DEI81_10485 [Curtobacterium sp. MCBD17_013]
MIPSVAQQLLAVRRTMATTVLPAIDPAQPFAAEQAGLILATLDRVLDVQASEYRYDVVEHADATALERALAALGSADAPPAGADTGDVRDADSDSDDTEVPDDLDELRASTTAAAKRAERRFRDLLTTDRADAARALMAHAARRSTERELAAARMTGFPRAVGSIAEVLARQATSSFGDVAVPADGEVTTR